MTYGNFTLPTLRTFCVDVLGRAIKHHHCRIASESFKQIFLLHACKAIEAHTYGYNWKGYKSMFARLCHLSIMYKYNKKFVILQSIGIIVIKSKETRVVTYTPADILNP